MKRFLTLAALAGFAPTSHVQKPVVPSPRDVVIETAGGSRLAATYYDPERSGPATIIFGNCDQPRSSLDRFARNLSGRGLHVVAYDYGKGAPPAGKTWRKWRSDDADDVLRWLNAQPGVDGARLVAVGGSCGSVLALDFAADHSRLMRGVVVLSAGPPDSSMKSFLSRTATVAILGGASTAEGSAPNLDELVKSSPNAESRLVIIPSGHGTQMLAESAAFETTVVEWIVARLGAA